MRQRIDIIAKLTTSKVLDLAYKWLCQTRQESHHNNSIWDLRFNWANCKPKPITASHRVSITMHILTKLQLTKHPDKAFIGRIITGFDFLGYHLTTKTITIGVNTIKRYTTKLYN